MSGGSQKIGFKPKPEKPLKARARTDKEVKRNSKILADLIF